MDGSPAGGAPGRTERRCPHCADPHIHRWGKPSGSQRYRCRNCGRTFNALTGTAVAGLRRPELWIDYRAALVEQLSIRKAAKRCGIDPSTALRWRRRLAAPAAAATAAPKAPSTARRRPAGALREPLDFVEWAHAMRAASDDGPTRARLDGMFGLAAPGGQPAPLSTRDAPRHGAGGAQRARKAPR